MDSKQDKRPSGTYWVVVEAAWIAARYFHGTELWQLPGGAGMFNDSFFGYISGDPIPEPGISARDAVRGKIVP